MRMTDEDVVKRAVQGSQARLRRLLGAVCVLSLITFGMGMLSARDRARLNRETEHFNQLAATRGRVVHFLANLRFRDGSINEQEQAELRRLLREAEVE